MRTIQKTIVLAAALAMSALAAPAEWPKKLVMGVVPTESSSHQTERWDGLVTYLSKKLGIPVELQNARDLWSKAQRAMENKDYTDARRYAEAAEAQARLAETKAQVAENQARLQAVQRGYQAQPAR